MTRQRRWAKEAYANCEHNEGFCTVGRRGDMLWMAARIKEMELRIDVLNMLVEREKKKHENETTKEG